MAASWTWGSPWEAAIARQNRASSFLGALRDLLTRVISPTVLGPPVWSSLRTARVFSVVSSRSEE